MHKQLIELLTDLRPQFGVPGTRDVDVRAKQERIDAAITVLKDSQAVIADPPVIAWQNPSTGAILHEESRDMCDNRRRFWVPLVSGAAQIGRGPAAPLTYLVGLATYNESRGTSYHVVARRSDRPQDTPWSDDIGMMNVFHSDVLEHAQAEQRAWSAFLSGPKPTRHIDFVTDMIDASGDRHVPFRDVAPGTLCEVHPFPSQLSFQARVQHWMLACFGAAIAADIMERNHRFYEEATELVQANGMTRHEAHQLVDYTYDRPVGELKQEVGGVMVTLAALCSPRSVDMYEAGETELARISVPSIMERVRAKQAGKPKHSPLPAAAGESLPDEFAKAYAAFQGAFDTPQMRRTIDNEYASDARRRLRMFAERIAASVPVYKLTA